MTHQEGPKAAAVDLHDSVQAVEGSQSTAARTRAAQRRAENHREFARLLERMDEKERQLRREVAEAQEAAERKRWWVIGFRTEVF